MRKVKQTITYTVPSWNFCNCDKSLKIGKETCRFCVKTKIGYVCTLYEAPLSAVSGTVSKCPQCVRLSAGFGVEVSESTVPKVDPRYIMRETLTNYKKTTNDLINQGYPRNMAETIATKYVLEEDLR